MWWMGARGYISFGVIIQCSSSTCHSLRATRRLCRSWTAPHQERIHDKNTFIRTYTYIHMYACIVIIEFIKISWASGQVCLCLFTISLLRKGYSHCRISNTLNFRILQIPSNALKFVWVSYFACHVVWTPPPTLYVNFEVREMTKRTILIFLPAFLSWAIPNFGFFAVAAPLPIKNLGHESP